MSQIINTFQNGLVMDFNPLTTPEGSLVNCLNGTYLTFNGNELVLQNDMGNGRVETAKLPSGYIPLGTTELGGIIYIVSYNPLNNKCQIGSFPSPERNFTPEDGDAKNILAFTVNDFIAEGKIKAYKVKKDITQFLIHPGDAFKVAGVFNEEFTNKISDLQTDETYGNDVKDIRFHIGTVNTSGEITYLDDDLKWFKFPEKAEKFFIQPITKKNGVEQYDDIVNTPYNIFTSKASANLCVIAELEVLDSFSVFWDVASVTERDNQTKVYTIQLNLDWNSENWKLRNELLKKEESLTDDAEPLCDKLNGLDIAIKKGTQTNATLNFSVGSTNSTETFSNGKATVENLETKNSYKEFTLQYTLSGKSDSILEFEITPRIDLFNQSNTTNKTNYPQETLTKTISIDLSKVGTGTKKLNEWRYYKDDELMLLNYGLEIYEKPTEEVEKVELMFYEVTNEIKISEKGVVVNEDNENDEIPPNFKLLKNNLRNFSGHYMESIVLDKQYNTITQEGKLESNKLYAVFINIKYKDSTVKDSKQTKTFYRWFYTSRVFNSSYALKPDFNMEYPNLDLTFDFEISKKSSNMNSGEFYKKTEISKVGDSIIIQDATEFHNYYDSDQGNIRYIKALKADFIENYEIIPELKFVDDYNIFTTTRFRPTYEVTQNTPTINHTEEIACEGNYTNLIEQILQEVMKGNKSEIKSNNLNLNLTYTIINPLTHAGYELKSLPYVNVLLPFIRDEQTAKSFGLVFRNGHFYYETFSCVSYYGENMHQGVGQLKFISKQDVKGLGEKESLFKANGHHYGPDSWQWRDLSNALVKHSGYNQSSIIPYFGITGIGGSNSFRAYQVFPSSCNTTINSTYVIPPIIHGDWTEECSLGNWNIGKNDYRMLSIYLMQSEDNDRYYIINNFIPIATTSQGCEKEAAYGKRNMTMGDIIANALSQIYYLHDASGIPPKKYYIIDNIHYYPEINIEKTITTKDACTGVGDFNDKCLFNINKSFFGTASNTLFTRNNVVLNLNDTADIIKEKSFTDSFAFKSNCYTDVNFNVDNSNVVFLYDGNFHELTVDESVLIKKNRLYQCVIRNGTDYYIKDITNKGKNIIGKDDRDELLESGPKTFKLLSWNSCDISDNDNYFTFNRNGANLNTVAHYLSDLKEKDGKLVIKSSAYTSNPNNSDKNLIKWWSDDSWHWCSQRNLSYGICFDDTFNILGNSLK